MNRRHLFAWLASAPFAVAAALRADPARATIARAEEPTGPVRFGVKGGNCISYGESLVPRIRNYHYSQRIEWARDEDNDHEGLVERAREAGMRPSTPRERKMIEDLTGGDR